MISQQTIAIPGLPPEASKMLRENPLITGVIIMYTIGAFSALDVAISSLCLFKRHRGLYFWSMQITSLGILLDAIPSLVAFVIAEDQLSSKIICAIGYGLMINGQPFVLYARLRLVVADIGRFRWVLWMIIITGITVYLSAGIPVIGLWLGNENFTIAAFNSTRVSVLVLLLQELIICVIYIHEARRALKPIVTIRGKEGKSVISHLIFLNVIIIILNTVEVVVTWRVAVFSAPLNAAIYGLKLKFEFAILNRLRSLLYSNSPYVFHGGGHGRGNRQDLDESQSTDYRRRSSELNFYAMINADLRTPHDVESGMLAPTLTPTPGVPNKFEPDPFASSFQISIANSESRRKRQRESQMESTLDFHEVVRETSSNDHMKLPASPAPTVVSYTSPGSLRSEHRFSSGSTMRGRIGLF